MMVFASVHCHGCGSDLERVFDATDSWLTCECGQRNAAPKKGTPITGLCDNCEYPIDHSGHDWIKSIFTHCRNERRRK